MIYGSDGDFRNPCYIYEINPSRDYLERRGVRANATMAPLDVAPAPAYTYQVQNAAGETVNVTAFGHPVILTYGQDLFLFQDLVSGTAVGWQLWTSYQDLCAIAYMGRTTYEEQPALQYLVLGADGARCISS